MTNEEQKQFYRPLFQNRLFVLKISGRLVTDAVARRMLVDDIKELTEDGIKVLLIYGGGAAIDEALKEQGVVSTKIGGRRITKQEDIRIIKKVLAGDLGFKLLESLVQAKLPCNILNAMPPHWAVAERKADHEGDQRFDGALQTVHNAAVAEHFTSTNLAVFPCLAFTSDGTALNINADTMAVMLATSLNADKLILMTDTKGVMKDGKTLSVLSSDEAQSLIDDGTAANGMQVKLENCLMALEKGVARVHILNGFTAHALRDEVYSRKGIGTMIVPEKEKETYIQNEMQQSGETI